MKEYMVDYIIL